MTPAAEEELLQLVEALCCGTITQPEHERLQARLAADPDARRLYFKYLNLHLQLRQWRRAAAKGKGESGPCSVGSGQLGDEGSGFRAQVLSAPVIAASPTPLSPLPFPLSLLPYVSSGAFLSYTIAALILGVGLLGVWAWENGRERSSREAAALPSVSPANQQGSASQLLTVIVGKITEAGNCQWTDPKTALGKGADVTLGRTLALKSGRLEMTYFAGTKVVIDGPAVYQVDAANGGYVKLGKSTFDIRLPKWRSTPNDKRPVPKAAMFAVHLPRNYTILLSEMKVALTVDPSGLAMGRAGTGTKWEICAPGHRLNSLVWPDSGALFVVDEKGVPVVGFEHREPAPAVAHQPPKGAGIYSGGPKGENLGLPAEKMKDNKTPKS